MNSGRGKHLARYFRFRTPHERTIGLARLADKALKKLLSKCTEVSTYKFGSRHKGHYAKLPDGKLVYIIERKHHQIYRAGKTTVNEATQEHIASWMLEHTVLRNLVKREIEYVIIFVMNTGEYYFAPLSRWQDKAVTHDSDTRLDRVRHLPLHIMTRGQVDIPFDKLAK